MARTYAHEIAQIQAEQAEQARAIAALVEGQARLIALLTPAEPAKVTRPAPVTAPVTEAPAPKTLTRGAWKALRLTKKGTVRKEFAGLTREQAFEAGLCPGFVLPTGAMRAQLAAHEA